MLFPSASRAFALVFLMVSASGCEFFGSDANGHDSNGVGKAVNDDDGGAYQLWVDLYYPGWRQERLPPEQLDLSGVTHIIHFAWLPWIAEGGTEVVIDDAMNGVDATAAEAVIRIGHAAGKKVLITIGGAGRGSQFFNQAMADTSRPAFIQALISKTLERGYDGIDVDWEPGWENASQGSGLFLKFSRELRAAIDATAPHLILTTAGLGADGPIYGVLADVYDQINIMTYDLVYGVPLTWHDSAISGGSGGFYSVDRSAVEYERAGVPRRALGIGLKCGGFSWENATEPMQNPMGSSPRSMAYSTIMTNHFSEAAYHWDERAQVPYLSILTPTPMFVTYDDARSAKAKIDYIRAGRYGGLIIWDASEQYFANGDATGAKHPLLQAVQQAVAQN
ncbi:MAG TPA: glycoside hydrolase family 18 protein [Polyangiaceae bacterium]